MSTQPMLNASLIILKASKVYIQHEGFKILYLRSQDYTCITVVGCSNATSKLLEKLGQ